MTTTYRNLTTAPAWQAPIWQGDKLMNPEAPFKWSGDADPPAIGTRIKVTMNRLGFGTVTGYFVEYGWLGVRVRFERPPRWWVKQNHPDRPDGHIFGVEFKSMRARKAAVKRSGDPGPQLLVDRLNGKL